MTVCLINFFFNFFNTVCKEKNGLNTIFLTIINLKDSKEIKEFRKGKLNSHNQAFLS